MMMREITPTYVANRRIFEATVRNSPIYFRVCKDSNPSWLGTAEVHGFISQIIPSETQRAVIMLKITTTDSDSVYPIVYNSGGQ
jgi:hypothetical protein